MARFESGVSRYIHASCTVTAHFPVDLKGNMDVRCSQCSFFRPSSRRCGLTGDLVEYPERYIGYTCPLIFELDEDELLAKELMEE